MLNKKEKGVIRTITPYSLHGTVYYNITFIDSNGELHETRLSLDALYEDPRIDDTILVHWLLNSVTHIEKVIDG